jgi:hypothetical protein
VTEFQSSAGWQGRQFAQQCDFLLQSNRFTLHGRRLLSELGVEIDQVATSPNGNELWFEYKGSFQGTRPGLMRTDTLKKAIANGALLRVLPDHPRYIVLTSHLPQRGSALSMLEAALDLGYLDQVICVNDPGDVQILAQL